MLMLPGRKEARIIRASDHDARTWKRPRSITAAPSGPIRADLSGSARPASILAAATALDSFVSISNMIHRRCGDVTRTSPARSRYRLTAGRGTLLP